MNNTQCEGGISANDNTTKLANILKEGTDFLARLWCFYEYSVSGKSKFVQGLRTGFRRNANLKTAPQQTECIQPSSLADGIVNFVKQFDQIHVRFQNFDRSTDSTERSCMFVLKLSNGSCKLEVQQLLCPHEAEIQAAADREKTERQSRCFACTLSKTTMCEVSSLKAFFTKI